MWIVERKVSAGDREIFDLDEFLSRPLYAHLAHDSENGPRESPVWFHWDGQAIWIIGGTSFPQNLKREPRAPSASWTGIRRRRANTLVCVVERTSSRRPSGRGTIFKKYFGPDEARWDPRFHEDIYGETGVPLVRFTPETVVVRDQSYKPPCGEPAT